MSHSDTPLIDVFIALLVNHNDRLIREAEVFLEEFDAEFTRFSHRFVLFAVERIKEHFLTDDVVGSVETQLLR